LKVNELFLECNSTVGGRTEFSELCHYRQLPMSIQVVFSLCCTILPQQNSKTKLRYFTDRAGTC